MEPPKVTLPPVAAAPQTEETISKEMADALLKATADELIHATPDAELIKGTARSSSAWRYAPAKIQLLAVADRRLNTTGRQAGLTGAKVERVHASLVKGTAYLILKPAPSTDTTAYEVKRSRNSGSMINLFPLLGQTRYTLETGWKDRFDVAYIPKESPLWPGLVIDLGNPKERRSTESKEEK